MKLDRLLERSSSGTVLGAADGLLSGHLEGRVLLSTDCAVLRLR
ncbi:hypothetical protein [Roseibium sp.]|nr:hypothetical protein [Roseibium sp.]